MRKYKVKVSDNISIVLTEEEMVFRVIMALTGFTSKWAEELDTPDKVLQKAAAFRKGKMVLSEKYDGTDHAFYHYNFLKGLALFWKDYPEWFEPTDKENEVKLSDKSTGVEMDKIIQYGIFKTVMWWAGK